jgi:hypothetical protein
MKQQVKTQFTQKNALSSYSSSIDGTKYTENIPTAPSPVDAAASTQFAQNNHALFTYSSSSMVENISTSLEDEEKMFVFHEKSTLSPLFFKQQQQDKAYSNYHEQHQEAGMI